MSATIYLIRHAEHVEFDRRLSGRRAGVPLSEGGRRQADRLATRLAATPLDRIEVSPLERTRQTAAALAATTGVAVAVEPSLIEIDMGEWTGRALDSFGEDPAWRAWNGHRSTARVPGGESMVEVQARIVARLQALTTEGGDPSVALVTHADVIRAALCWALRLSLDNLLRFDIGPASVSRVVVGEWGARVLAMNEGVCDG